MHIEGWASLSTFAVGVVVTVDQDFTDGWDLVLHFDLGLFGCQVSIGAPSEGA